MDIWNEDCLEDESFPKQFPLEILYNFRLIPENNLKRLLEGFYEGYYGATGYLRTSNTIETIEASDSLEILYEAMKILN